MIKYYLVVFLTFSLISVGILLLKNPFFLFANAAAEMLNCMLEPKRGKANKKKNLMHSLDNLLPKFGLMIFFIAMTIGVSFIPVVVYLEYNPEKSFHDLDKSSIYFFISIILGSVTLFIVPWANRNRDSDYSGWSMLLHRMILPNYNISSAFFWLEKKLFKKKINSPDKDFVIVSGLARAGGTALTNMLFASNRFHSLSYDNMPFLLGINIWRKLAHLRMNKSKQRANSDNIMFGYKTIVTLEEYFFKVFLNDLFIKGHTLLEHEIDQRTYEDYLNYQKLIRYKKRDTIYLAKNDNLILRYKSLRTYNPHFKIVLIFRSPLPHAYALLSQHNRFCDMQEADPFTLEYMNWLGYHAFGLNHKLFHLELMELCKQYDSSSIDYWIAIWISYYTHILSMMEDKNLFLIEYADLVTNPKELLSRLGKLLNLNLAVDHPDMYPERNTENLEPDTLLIQRAEALYRDLLQYKIVAT